MIEVNPEKDKFSSCNSCGSTENLKSISIRRSINVNGMSITLCDACRKEISK